MLLHIEPHICAPFREVAVVDLVLEPLGMRLIGGVDLSTGRPYPNKRHKVACRKNKTRKAFNGILIETPSPLDTFDIVTRWAINAEIVVTHHVHYRLLDHDFDAASNLTLLWYACSGSLGEWRDRWPVGPENRNREVLFGQPEMAIEPGSMEAQRPGNDLIDLRSGWIVAREETFYMPTIERERIAKTKLLDRMPPLASAFIL